MRRRSRVLAALAGGLLLSLVTAAPAIADESPSPSPSPTATADPVDLRITGANSTAASPATPRGSNGGVGFMVFGASPGATLTLQLPAGLSFVDASVDQHVSTCTTGAGTATCDLGALDPSVFTSGYIGLHVDPAAPIGRLQVVATVTPAPGPDANPDDNTASLAFDVAGHADVTQVGPDSPVIVSEPGGGSFLFHLHNAGPDPATHLRTRFTIQSNDATPPTFQDFGAATVVDENGGKVWEVGTLAAGATATLQVTLHALGPVRDSEVTWSTSYDGVPELCAGSPSCVFGAQIRSVPAPSTGVGQINPNVPQLADTGSAASALTAVGLAFVVAGAATVAVGRRRRRA